MFYLFLSILYYEVLYKPTKSIGNNTTNNPAFSNLNMWAYFASDFFSRNIVYKFVSLSPQS